jgi:hypothetical protein
MQAPSPVLSPDARDDQSMDDRRPSGGKKPPQHTEPRRTANLPTGGSKAAAGTENTPKSSPDAAISPEKLNAENDK